MRSFQTISSHFVFVSLNPFPQYSDPYNLRMGNPFLRPEFINNNSVMTILRQVLRTFNYVVVSREKYINGEKLINYNFISLFYYIFNSIYN